MIVLGIESSCDETSVAILKDGVVSTNLISSQDFHKNYGGVVPELSSRAHLQIINPLVKDALQKSSVQLTDIDLICATAGPGLIGALLVGLTYAKGLAYSIDKPFIGVNHIEGHIFSGFLMDVKPDFPFLALVVSGGHTLLLLVNNFNEIIKLGSTVDDAAGEAFDKVSKMIGLGYPGGPKIQNAAMKGDEKKLNFPVARLKDPYNFSFSGVKTSVLRYVQSLADKPDDKMISDIAASFQNSIVRALIEKLEKAINNFPVKSVSVVGGVAANKLLRESALLITKKHNLKLVIPAFEYCGDNAAMIAFRGSSLYESGVRDSLDFKPFPGITKDHFKELR